MLTCEHCRERLFDYVYGLQEADELQQTREHLRGCLSCQATLAQVETQQGLMARAARAINTVPEFTLPLETAAATSITADPAPIPASLPMTTKAPRSFWRRPWVAWTVAAALLLTVGSSVSYYRTKLDGYRRDLAKQRKQYDLLDGEFAVLPAKYADVQEKLTKEVRDAASPYVHMVGLTQLQPNGKANLYITTRNAEGKPAQSNLRVRLVEAHTGNEIHFVRTQSDELGKARVELDAGAAKPGSSLRVSVDAETGAGRARVQDNIRVRTPTYVTRIDTNKILYQSNDVLFFRVLVLDRYSLLPPAQPILVRVALIDPKNQVVAQLDLATAEGGIVAREFPITEKFLAGQYTLTVDPLEAGQTPVQPATHRLEVVRDLRTPDLLVDQRRYLPGDEVSGIVRGGPAPERAMAKFDNQPPVAVTVTPDVQAFSAIPEIGRGGALPPKKGNVATPGAAPQSQTFRFAIPKQLPAGTTKFLPFTLEFETGKKMTTFAGVVPLEPTDLDIDFFPEGGDLIAGVSNRVYYRIRAKGGAPVTSAGSVILWTNKDVIDSTYQLGLGYFDFTPELKGAYTIRITSPVQTIEIQDPFARLGIRPAGVVLHLPTAVGKQGDSIRLTIRNQGPARRLLLVAQCRGQVVDQQWVDVKLGAQDFTLEPTLDARGIIKVTAYEVTPMTLAANVKTVAGFLGAAAESIESILTPVAERLAYRSAVQRLDLGVTLGTQQHLPGKNMLLKINAHTERGDPANNWILASVADERFLARSRSLSAHFMLLNEIRAGSELEDAQVVLHDAPESAQMLERFLGTHGWRRFIPAAQSGAATPLVFSRENMPTEQVQKQHEANLDAVLAPMRKTAFREEDELRAQRMHAAVAVQIAAAEFSDFENRFRTGLGVALGALLAVLLCASLVLMFVGTYRLIRQTQGATSIFGSAFACLAICLGILFLGTLLPMAPANLFKQNVADGMAFHAPLEQVLAQGPKQPHLPEDAPPARTHALRAAAWDDMQPIQTAADKTSAKASANAYVAMQDNKARAFTRDLFDRSKDPGQPPPLNNALELRRKQAEQALKIAEKGGKGDSPIPLSKGKKDGKAPDPQPVAPIAKADAEAKKLVGVEYAHPYAPGLYSDTLLWHPALWIANGAGEVRFDIASGQTTYRVLLLGHSTTGRFGFFETRLDVLPVEADPPRGK